MRADVARSASAAPDRRTLTPVVKPAVSLAAVSAALPATVMVRGGGSSANAAGAGTAGAARARMSLDMHPLRARRPDGTMTSLAPVAQLDRAAGFYPAGSRFE